MQLGFNLKAILSLLSCCLASCQTSSINDQGYTRDQLRAIEKVNSQFEATELSKCIDSNGETTGSLNVIWQIRDSGNDISAPFITGFSGSLFSLKGTKIEFQAFTASKLNNFTAPPVVNQRLFPLSSYSAYTLHFPFDEQTSGWAFLKLDGRHIKPTDVTGAELLIPKYAIGGQYSTRYYLKIRGGHFHEFSCQPISSELRVRLNTFQKRTGEHEHSGSRGRTVELYLPTQQPKTLRQRKNNLKNASNSAAAEELLEVISEPEKAANTSVRETRPNLDLRPIGRPKSYDITYKHIRVYECGENGSVDAIWKIRSSDGKSLNTDTRFITGFAAELKDEQKKAAFYFSSVEIDSEPAFYSGVMPSGSTYYFPTLKFSPESIEKNESAHSKIALLKKGERVAGATIYLPRSGLGEMVSVSLALGKSLRGTPYQATVNCIATSPKLKYWYKYCLGKNSTQLKVRSCNL